MVFMYFRQLLIIRLFSASGREGLIVFARQEMWWQVTPRGRAFVATPLPYYTHTCNELKCPKICNHQLIGSNSFTVSSVRVSNSTEATNLNRRISLQLALRQVAWIIYFDIERVTLCLYVKPKKNSAMLMYQFC